MRRCSNPDCHFPEGPCAKRHFEPEADCHDLREGSNFDASSVFEGGADLLEALDEPLELETRAPSRFWTGLALGSHESLPTLVDNPPVVVTVAGREATGKTCLLVAQYLRVANGCPAVFPYRFCGSRTLRGFEQLSAAAFAWTGGDGEAIVPRTNLGSHREPSFLHMAFRERVAPGSDQLHPEVTNLLLTDMPGEWFYRWSREAGYESSLPFLPRSDVFWVVVDAPRLIVDRRADRDALDLLNRVLDFASDGRPVALVLTQIDLVETPEPDQLADISAWGGKLARPLRRLNERLQRHNGPTGFYPVSAFPGPGGAPPVGIIDPLRIALQVRHDGDREPVPRPPHRYFHQFRELA